MNPNASRNILMLMSFTVVFALLGYEIKLSKTSTAANPSAGISGGGRIIVGGVVGGVLLIGISHAGDAGAQFAQGLAMVAAATAILVEGGPVWALIGGLYGNSSPTTPTGSTPTTSPTGG